MKHLDSLGFFAIFLHVLLILLEGAAMLDRRGGGRAAPRFACARARLRGPNPLDLIYQFDEKRFFRNKVKAIVSKIKITVIETRLKKNSNNLWKNSSALPFTLFIQFLSFEHVGVVGV
jgi:hypothetical protein